MSDMNRNISKTASLQEVLMFNTLIKLFVFTIFTALFVIVGFNSANAFEFPDSDQTDCVEVANAGVENKCENVFQETENNIKPRSFTLNDESVLTDDNTGLMWQQQDDGNTYTWYQASGTYDEMYNPASENVCGNLVVSGYSDWRLPTKNELISIVDYAIPFLSETIKTTYFPDTKPSGYWSSTVYDNYPGYAWAVYFNDGGVYSNSKYYDVYVRCVRGGKSTPIEYLSRTAHSR